MLWLIAFIFSGDIVRPPMQCNGVANEHDTMGSNNLWSNVFIYIIHLYNPFLFESIKLKVRKSLKKIVVSSIPPKNQRINLRYCIPGYSSFKIETGFFPSSSIQSSRSQCALGLLFSATVLVSLILNPQMVSMAFWEHASFASFFDLPRKIDEIKRRWSYW